MNTHSPRRDENRLTTRVFSPSFHSALFCILLALFLLPAPAALAQSPTATPEAPPAAASIDGLQSALERAEAAAARAEKAASEAANAVDESRDARDLAFNLLGLFEAISFLVTIAAGVAALFGVTRLISAQNELSEARKRVEAELAQSRERFAQELKAREDELTAMRDQLTQTAAEQRAESAQASLAQSLLPLGERQYRAQDYVGALDTYKRALELDPDNLIIHYRLGYVFTQSGELEAARSHLTRALEIEHNFAPAIAALGYVYRRIGETMEPGIDRDQMLNEAESKFLEALKISPKLVDEDGESWWGALGGLYRRRGQVDQAIQAYERGTEVTPHSSYPFSNLALLYIQKHNREAMLRTYRRVERLAAGEVQAEVDNYWAYADLIVARLALGKIKEVEDILQTALETAPVDSPYTLESLLDTLNRLCDALNPDEVPPVRRIMEQIRQFKDRRKAAAQEPERSEWGVGK